MKTNELPSVEELNSLFNYDPETGVLTWKKSQGTIKSGKVAGSKHSEKKPYLKVRINRKAYLAHRIIYKMWHGECPKDKMVDHINGVKDDNRIENLRLLNNADNVYNAKPRVDNNSGIKGVFYNKQREKWEVTHRGVYIGGYHHFGVAVEVKKGLEKFEGVIHGLT